MSNDVEYKVLLRNNTGRYAPYADKGDVLVQVYSTEDIEKAKKKAIDAYAYGCDWLQGDGKVEVLTIEKVERKRHSA